MLGAVQHGHRHHIGAAGQVDRRALDLFLVRHRFDEHVQWQGLTLQLVQQTDAAGAPGFHDQENQRGSHQRHPATLLHLDQVGGDEGGVDKDQQRGNQQRNAQRPFPLVAHHLEHQHAGQQHGQRHRNAIGRSQVVRGLEAQRQAYGEHHQQPVHDAHIDLAIAGFRSLGYVQSWTQTQLNRLARHREHAADDGLAGDDGGGRCQHHQRNLHPVRPQQEERIAALRHLAGGDQCRLAGVVQQQHGQHQHVPTHADWPGAEVAHVGVQRLGTCGAQEYRAQHGEAGVAMRHQKAQARQRIHRPQHLGVLHDGEQAQHAQGQEPDDHHRPEQLADHRRALALQDEQKQQHDHGNRQNEGLEAGQRCFQAFERAEHRNRRCDRTISVQQCRTQNAHGDQAAALLALQRQIGHQRQDTALTLVVGAHDQGNVLDRGGDDQGPDDQRKHAIGGFRRCVAGRVQRGFQRVQRTGAYVAENDTQGPQHQDPQRAGRLVMGRAVDGGRGVAHVESGALNSRDGGICVYTNTGRWLDDA